MKSFFKNRAPIVIAIALVVMTPIIMVLGWNFRKTTEKEIERVILDEFSKREFASAGEIAGILELHFTTLQDKLKLLAQIPEIRSGDTEACSRTLKQMVADLEIKPGNLGRMNADGEFYCGVADSIVGVDGTQYDYLQDILKDPNHDPVLSKRVLFKYQVGERYLVALHIPVFSEDGKFTGTLGGAIYLDEIAEKYLHLTNARTDNSLVLVDDNGDILAHADANLIGANIYEADSNLTQKDIIGQLIAQPSVGIRQYQSDAGNMLVSARDANVFPRRTWHIIVFTSLGELDQAIFPLLAQLQTGTIALLALLLIVLVGMIAMLFVWNSNLKKQVGLQTGKIADLNDVLKILNKILRHDILNDVTVIENGIKMFKDGSDQEGLEVSFQALNRSKNTISKMRELEGAVSAGKQLEPVNVKAVSEAVANSFSELNITVTGEATAQADKALNSVIENLVRNAKMHGQTDKVEIVIEKKNDMVEIKVKDWGKGIPDDIKSKLFTEGFKYGDTGNTGLGLYIVKKTIERYGGDVAVVDNEPQGTVLTLTFQASKKQE